KTEKILSSLQPLWRESHIQARFFGHWLALFVMGTTNWKRLAKWNGTRRFEKDPEFKRYMTNLFAGISDSPLAIHDLPYLLVLLPSKIRKHFIAGRLGLALAHGQNLLLAAPPGLKRQVLRDKAAL